MGNRKEEILIVALHLFARDGYEAVSVSQIAGELDMTKGALYRHYKSKRDIFDSIVKRMEQQDGVVFIRRQGSVLFVGDANLVQRSSISQGEGVGKIQEFGLDGRKLHGCTERGLVSKKRPAPGGRRSS